MEKFPFRRLLCLVALVAIFFAAVEVVLIPLLETQDWDALLGGVIMTALALPSIRKVFDKAMLDK